MRIEGLRPSRGGLLDSEVLRKQPGRLRQGCPHIDQLAGTLLAARGWSCFEDLLAAHLAMVCAMRTELCARWARNRDACLLIGANPYPARVG